MAKYLVETDGGKYEVETEDAPVSAAKPSRLLSENTAITQGKPDLLESLAGTAPTNPALKRIADLMLQEQLLLLWDMIIRFKQKAQQYRQQLILQVLQEQ
jgi:hypothetical protein